MLHGVYHFGSELFCPFEVVAEEDLQIATCKRYSTTMHRGKNTHTPPTRVALNAPRVEHVQKVSQRRDSQSAYIPFLPIQHDV